jgi:hypothetical protein
MLDIGKKNTVLQVPDEKKLQQQTNASKSQETKSSVTEQKSLSCGSDALPGRKKRKKKKREKIHFNHQRKTKRMERKERKKKTRQKQNRRNSVAIKRNSSHQTNPKLEKQQGSPSRRV